MTKIEPLRARARTWWGALEPKQRHFWQNVAIGFGLLIALQCIERLGLFATVKQFGLDWQIAAISGTHHGDRIALIDIDQPSELSFGTNGGPPPYFTPRDKLKALIAAAVTAGAAAIVVDIDLTEPPGDPIREAYRELTGRPPVASDDALERRLKALSPPASLDPVQHFFYANWQLSEYLAKHSRDCAGKPFPPAPGSCVPIILARPVGTSTTAPRLALPSFLDLATRDSRGVFWGSVTFDHDQDFIVRRWRLWEPACTIDGASDVLPSSALLAFAFGKPLRPQESWDYQDAIANLQQNFAPDECRSGPRLQQREPPRFRGIELTSEDVPRTLRYSISWRDGEGASLERDLPADQVLAPGYQLDLACAGPAGCKRIVVIGSTYRDNGDYHRIPGGEMPGSIVLVNEIDSLMSDNPVVREAPWILQIFLEVVLIVALAWAFLLWDPTAVLVFALVFTVAGLLTSTLISLQNGEWFDIVVPLIGIQIHEWVARAEHFRLTKKEE